MQGGEKAGLLVGIVILLVLGWVPIIGPLVGGFATGLSCRKRQRGSAYGFVAGSVASLILVWFFYAAGARVFVVTEGPLSGFIGNALTFLYSLGPIFLVVQTVILATLGGTLGAIRRERWSK